MADRKTFWDRALFGTSPPAEEQDEEAVDATYGWPATPPKVQPDVLQAIKLLEQCVTIAKDKVNQLKKLTVNAISKPKWERHRRAVGISRELEKGVKSLLKLEEQLNTCVSMLNKQQAILAIHQGSCLESNCCVAHQMFHLVLKGLSAEEALTEVTLPSRDISVAESASVIIAAETNEQQSS